jgi:hypothetical protein
MCLNETCNKVRIGKHLSGGGWVVGKVGSQTDLGEIGWGGMDWIYRAQDWNQLRAFVNMIMNLHFCKMVVSS